MRRCGSWRTCWRPAAGRSSRAAGRPATAGSHAAVAIEPRQRTAELPMRTLIVLASLLACTAVPAFAQEVPSQLTLEDALRIARQRNPGFRSALNDEDLTVMAERAAWSQFLPSVSASMTTGLGSSR